MSRAARSIGGAALGAWLAGCAQVSVSAVNAPPTALVVQPTAGATWIEGEARALVGQVGDRDDGAAALRATWRVDGAVACADVAPTDRGEVGCEVVLGAGEHTAQLAVVDPDGAAAADEVAFRVAADATPAVTLARPADGAEVEADVTLVVEATVSDAEDAASSLAVRVFSDQAGELATPTPGPGGEVSAQVRLPVGVHLLVVEATDHLGHIGRASAVVTARARDAAPTCAWVTPLDGAVWPEAGPFLGELAAADDLTAPGDLAVVVTSARDGVVWQGGVGADGVAAIALPPLSMGAHTLTAEVRDSEGQTCVDVVTARVDAAPTAAWSAGIDGAVWPDDGPQTLTGAVADPEDAPAALTVAVSSDVDGLLRTGAPDAGGAVTVVRALSPGAHRLRLRVTDTAGQQAEASAQVWVDRRPLAPALHLEPAAPLTDDALLAVLDAPPVDPDGDAVEVVWRWLRDGVDQPEGGPAIGADRTARGERWTVQAWGRAGGLDGPWAEASVTIADTAPEVGVPVVAPDPADASTPLRCEVGPAFDADGDAVTLAVTWWVGDVAIAQGDALDAGIARRGEAVRCAVTPDDGSLTGATQTSAPRLLRNAVPSLARATLSPATLVASSTPRCAGEGFVDADGDADQSVARWSVGGRDAGGGASPEGALARGDVVTCAVTPYDGLEEGAPVLASATVANSPPALDGVQISPSAPQPGDGVSCAAMGVNDGDGDVVDVQYAWFEDGSPVASGPVWGGPLTRGRSVRCEVTLDDGFDVVVRSAVVEVGNAAPSVDAAFVSPALPAVTDALTCVAVGIVDADGDPVTLDVRWRVGGVEVAAGASLPAGVARRGQAVSCSVTPTDGRSTGAPVASPAVEIRDLAPTATGARIEPAAPLAGDALRCLLDGVADADGDAVEVEVAWTVNGLPVGGGDVLPVSVVRGDGVGCVATPTDGTLAGAAFAASAVVGNTPPTLGGAAIAPSAPRAGDTLSCAPTNPADVDGDALSTTYAWSVDGAPAGSGAALGAPLARGQVVSCAVTVDDGLDASPARVATVVVGNTPPVASTPTVTPVAPTSADALTCSPGLSVDADGDPVALALRWEVDDGAGGEATVGVGSALSAGVTSRGARVRCVVTPSDGVEAGADAPSGWVTVGNAPPRAAAAAIVPTPLRAGDTPSCVAVGFSDADGDADASTVAWTVDGVSSGAGNPLVAPLARGAVVGCALTPSDGRDAGPPVTATATVANTAPTLAGALISPRDPDRTSVLTCAPVDAADADGDALTLSWAWFVDGVQVSEAPALTGGLRRGAVVTCRLTASDGVSTSPAVTDAVTVGDAAPSVTGGSLSPSPLRTDDTAAVSVSSSDPDGDAVTVRYAWTVNGASAGTDAASLSGAAFAKGDLVAVTVTPSDGQREGAPYVVGPVTVVDTPPTAPVVQIGPEGARPRTPLVCALITPSVDADGDAVSYAWSWSSTGGAVTPVSGTWPGDTVPGVQVLGGTYTCTVTPSAGGAAGDAGVDTLVVEPLFPSATIQLADTSVQVFGGVASENLGRGPCTVAALDVDGDGLDDVAVGAPDANTPLADSGAVWVFLSDQLVAGTDRSTATAHTSILGDQFSGQLGRCVLNAGDLDGDGGDELLIGAPNRDGGLTDNGAVLLFASSDLLAGGTLGPSDALRAWTGPAANDLAGFSLGRADVDGQGVADLLVGAPQLSTSGTGRVYVLRGEALPASGSLSASAMSVFETSETRARFGESLVGVPDLDGDGRDEIAVGAPLSDEGVNDGGAIYVLAGASLPALPARANVASSLLRLRGVSTADNAGTRLVAGDLDGDGLPELVVGAPYRNLTGVDDGVVYVVQGTVVSGGGAGSLASVALRVDGAAAGDLTGAGLALVPDLSYDGLPELLIGAQGRDTQGLEAGEATLWTSQQLALGGVASAMSADYRFLGEDRNDLAGQVAGAGDVDGDGRGDLFVLAPGEGSQVGSGGRLYIVLAP